MEGLGMKSEINERGKPVWSGVGFDADFALLDFHEVDMSWTDSDMQWALHTNLGSITVLDRMTGFSGCVRDVETGFRDSNGKFWLASGNFDVRDYNPKTFGEAVDLIKRNANNCVGE